MEAKENKKVIFRPHQFRGDYEILDVDGKCRGFIWKFHGKWACRVDDNPTQHLDSFKHAKELAGDLVEEAQASPCGALKM